MHSSQTIQANGLSWQSVCFTQSTMSSTILVMETMETTQVSIVNDFNARYQVNDRPRTPVTPAQIAKTAQTLDNPSGQSGIGKMSSVPSPNSERLKS